MSIGKNIETIRKKRNLTAKELGELTGVFKTDASTRISKYENGKMNPKPQVLEAIADVLNVDPMALCASVDSEKEAEYLLMLIAEQYGLEIYSDNGQPALKVAEDEINQHKSMYDFLAEWLEVEKNYEAGEISKEQLEEWKLNWPKFSKSRITGFISGKPTNEDRDQWKSKK